MSAITEDENEISLRDASSTRERPTLEGFDMDDDHILSIEVLTNMSADPVLASEGRVPLQR